MTTVTTAAAPDPRSAELDDIARQMLGSVTNARVWSLSLHDEHADVLWLNESVLGPDEHEAVRASLEVFAGEGAPQRHEHDLGDGRVAVTFRAARGGSVLGVLMIIVDRKAVMTEALGPASGAAGPLLAQIGRFCAWLSADLSATQLRLRALPDLPTPEVVATTTADSGLNRTLEEELTATLELLGPSTVAAAAATPGDFATATATTVIAKSAEPELTLLPDPAPAAAAAAAASAAPAAPAAPAASTPAPVDAALDRHYAALRAQPIVLYTQQLEPLTEGNRIRRYEILLRTGSEHGRSRAPTAMIEAAAKHGLGSVVDRRVITDLVLWLARNPEVWRSDPINVSVNLSPTALVDPHFFKFLDLCMTKADLPRGMIAFELDAARCAQSPARTADAAQLLAAIGCTIILDDYDMSAEQVELLTLKGLRMLKLHPSLTTDIGADKRRQAVVAGAAQMASVLGMYTCAKSIESRDDVRALAALKVDFSQGFGFSKPAPLSDLARPADAQPKA
ncbi:MAG: EAL domain-containing protein [Proteobacteria bacterium]|nr:EAL domain-containing protein [Pseudomonadota bacterium]